MMDNIKNVDYTALMDVKQQIKKPFARENFVANIKPEYGIGTFVWYNSGSGIATSKNNIKLNQNISARLKSNIPGAVLIFNLANECTHIYQDGNQHILQENEYFLGFSSDHFSVDIQFEQGKHYSTLNVGIKEALFLELTHELVNLNEKMREATSKGYAILKGGKIDPEQQEILKFFKEKDLNEFLITDLNLESKTINLLHYTIKKVVDNINKNHGFHKAIIDSLHKAKQIIQEQYNENLTIKNIAYKSAINECYLKKDFKRYYGQTVYEMLQQQRLNVAKKLLQEDYSVKEVCNKVGYKHTGNFSKLFAQYFNISPSNYKKQFR